MWTGADRDLKDAHTRDTMFEVRCPVLADSRGIFGQMRRVWAAHFGCWETEQAAHVTAPPAKNMCA